MSKVKNLKLKELDLSDIFFCINKMRIYENKELVSLNHINKLDVTYVVSCLNKLKNKSKIESFVHSRDNEGTSYLYLYKTSEYILNLIDKKKINIIKEYKMEGEYNNV